jgi:phage baseplate assembly protein W
MSFDLKLKNGDLIINQGKLQTVVDSEKLIQDILKICLTTAGSNPMHPWYGSLITRTIIGNPQYSAILSDLSKNQLNSALEALKAMQESQVRSFQRVSAEEQISSIVDISVIRNQDPRLFNVSIKVLTKALKPVSTNFRISTI